MRAKGSGAASFATGGSNRDEVINFLPIGWLDLPRARWRDYLPRIGPSGPVFADGAALPGLFVT